MKIWTEIETLGDHRQYVVVRMQLLDGTAMNSCFEFNEDKDEFKQFREKILPSLEHMYASLYSKKNSFKTKIEEKIAALKSEIEALENLMILKDNLRANQD